MRKILVLLIIMGSVVALLSGCGGGLGKQELAKELHVYNWSEYIDPQIYADFEEEFGVHVVEDTFASNEELLAKLQAGARALFEEKLS